MFMTKESSTLFYNFFVSYLLYLMFLSLVVCLLVLVFPVTFDCLYIYLFVAYYYILYLIPWSSDLFFVGCVSEVSRCYFYSLRGSLVAGNAITVGGNGVLLPTLIGSEC